MFAGGGNMRISQLLDSKRAGIVHVSPSASIGTAISLMQREHVGAVLVLDAEQRLLGVLSERDVVHGLASDPQNLLSRAAIDIARKDNPFATPDDTVQSVMEVMTVTRARHVPVIEFGRAIGVVSIGDIVKSRLAEKTQENTVLQEIVRARFFAH
jgi:CBS domain-containing protein